MGFTGVKFHPEISGVITPSLPALQKKNTPKNFRKNLKDSDRGVITLGMFEEKIKTPAVSRQLQSFFWRGEEGKEI